MGKGVGEMGNRMGAWGMMKGYEGEDGTRGLSGRVQGPKELVWSVMLSEIASARRS